MTDLAHSDAALLHEMHVTWGDWYIIAVNPDGIWHAHRRSNPAHLITAESGDEFRELIAADAEEHDAETASLIMADRCQNCGVPYDEHDTWCQPYGGRWRGRLIIGACFVFAAGVWLALFLAYTH